MTNVEIVEETPLSIAEVKDELDKIKKRDKELNFRAQKAEEYLQVFSGSKKQLDLKKKIEGLKIPRLREPHICKIVDLMPTTANDLKAVLQGYPISVTNENIKKIVDVVKEFQ
ncbi:hypothetical protein ACFLZX_04280 [Nanoarchaeota archaeon]